MQSWQTVLEASPETQNLKSAPVPMIRKKVFQGEFQSSAVWLSIHKQVYLKVLIMDLASILTKQVESKLSHLLTTYFKNV
jgi:hypothetical protein